MKCIIIISFLILSLTVYSDTTNMFTVRTGDETDFEYFTISETCRGFILETLNDRSVMDDHGCQLSWDVSRNSEQINFLAVKVNNAIQLKGIFEGEEINYTYDLGTFNWYQYPEYSFIDFVLSDDEEMEFCIISINDLKLYEFEAVKLETPVLMINDVYMDTIRIRIKPTGFYGAFWHADYWFRSTDGNFVRYEAVHGAPGTTPTIKEILLK